MGKGSTSIFWNQSHLTAILLNAKVQKGFNVQVYQGFNIRMYQIFDVNMYQGLTVKVE